MTKSKILAKNVFWSESIQNFSKRILNRKNLEIENFSRVFFCSDLVVFGQKAKNSEKMTKSQIFLTKFFSDEIDSECFKTYFKPKISKSKFFSCVKFFCSDLVFFRPKGQKKLKNDTVQIFGRKFFLVGIDAECFKTNFKPRISKSKIFSLVKFFWSDLVVMKNDKVQKFWQKKILVEINSECFKTYLKPKISKSKIFPVYFLLRLSRFSVKKPKIVKKWQSSEILAKNLFDRNQFRIFLNLF